MFHKFKDLLPVVMAVAVAAGCSSGSNIRETGFIAAPAGDGFSVSFQNNSVTGEDGAKDNLFYHAARFTIDRGDIYFTLDDVTTDRKTNVDRETTQGSMPSAMEPDPSATTNPAPTPAPATSQLGTRSATMYRTAAAKGILHTYKVKPDGVTSYEARQVLDDLR